MVISCILSSVEEFIREFKQEKETKERMMLKCKVVQLVRRIIIAMHDDDDIYSRILEQPASYS